MLVDAGAEVIKVEKIGGEDLRKSKPFIKQIVYYSLFLIEEKNL